MKNKIKQQEIHKSRISAAQTESFQVNYDIRC